jgi:hypothetical protein
MRRALVLTDETRRHPLRASLPPESLRVENVETDRPPYWRLALTGRDWRDICATYCAGFTAVTIFFS